MTKVCFLFLLQQLIKENAVDATPQHRPRSVHPGQLQAGHEASESCWDATFALYTQG